MDLCCLKKHDDDDDDDDDDWIVVYHVGGPIPWWLTSSRIWCLYHCASQPC